MGSIKFLKGYKNFFFGFFIVYLESLENFFYRGNCKYKFFDIVVGVCRGG